MDTRGNIKYFHNGQKASLSQELDDIKSTVESNFDTLDEAIKQNAQDIAQNSSDIATNNQTATTEINSLKGRMTTAEGKIEANQQNISTNATNITKNSVDIQTNKDDIDALEGRMDTAESDISTIKSKIPTQASATNQLADKDFVNSTVSTFASDYITKNANGDPFSTKAELTSATTFYCGGVVRVPTRNDYCTVLSDESQPQDQFGQYPTSRYTYQGNQWELSFVVNNTSFTAAQLNALNSNITATLTEQISLNQAAIPVAKQEAIQTATSQRLYMACQSTYASVTDGTMNFTVEDESALLVHKKSFKAFIINLNVTDITSYDDVPQATKLQITFDGTVLPIYTSSGNRQLVWGDLVDYYGYKAESIVILLDAVLMGGSNLDAFWVDISSGHIRYDRFQQLTDAQRKLARDNIGAGDSGFSGDYKDLSNIPVLNTTNTSSLSTSATEQINGTLNLHKISKTGSFNDLNNIPAFGSLAYKSTVTNDDITNSTIAKTKLASAVQTSLGAADTAVQSVTGSNGVSASKSGTTVTVSGVDATNSAKGVTKLYKSSQSDAFTQDDGATSPLNVKRALTTESTSLNSTFNATSSHRGTMSKDDKAKLDTLSLPKKSALLTLTIGGWASNKQKVSVTLDTSKLNTIVPVLGTNGANVMAWANAGVNAILEESNGITFQCTTVPSQNLTFYVISESIS